MTQLVFWGFGQDTCQWIVSQPSIQKDLANLKWAKTKVAGLALVELH